MVFDSQILNMKKFKKYIVLLICLFSIFSLQSQELSTTSRKAIKAFNEAEQAFRMKNNHNVEMWVNLAIEADSNFFEAWILKGEFYEEMKKDSNAIVVYQHALAIDSLKYPGAWFFMANLEYKNGMYEVAIDHYQHYLRFPNIREARISEINHYITNCQFAIEAIQSPVLFEPKNLGSNVNSKHNDYFPCLTADNSTLLFTRLLPDERAFTGRQEDFYISLKNEGEWSQAIEIGKPINTEYNEGAPSLSVDGNTLIFTACESINGYGEDRYGYGRCDLFISQKSGSSWIEPENVGQPVNSEFWESQPSLSADGMSLYFVSNRDRNYNIWVAQINEYGDWGKPQKLNDNINTSGYEGSVFIHPDNQTLYFSSDGLVGMGGLDIYMSRRDSTGDWGKAINLGYPINTHKDENSIVISAEGELAMFASDRADGFGGLDIYEFELYEEARPQFVTYMKGKVFDAESKKKLGARFELIDLKTSEVMIKSQANIGSGEFIVCIPTERDYALNVSFDGYLFYSENFNLTGVYSNTEPFLMDIPLKPIKAGESVVMKNVFFEHDKYLLLDGSKVELGKLITFLEQNPTVKIEIGGHTDNVGDTVYNLELSQKRAKAVNDYLVEMGMDQVRLLYKGYGESQPVDTNETEEGRANNRRTEVRILE